jgi:hypothetical protein
LSAKRRPSKKSGNRSSRRAGQSQNGPGKKSGADREQVAAASGVRVRQRPSDGAWELVMPRCARDRKEDLEEVHKMLEAGEYEVARDECLWLLQGCTDCLDAHRILGEIALEMNDLPLARGHFGYAYRLGMQAIERAGGVAPLPYRVSANQSFLESGKALAWCLLQLNKREMAAEVVEAILGCDPSDPLGVKGLLDPPPCSG